MGAVTQVIKSAIVNAYTYTRHPESISLSRRGVRYDHYRELNKPWLVDLGIKTIIDIGANTGQFARLARAVFPDATIFSFEPLPECFAELRSALSSDKDFVPHQMGIGSHPHELDFFRSFHSPSSSFLKMDRLHREAFPYTSDGQEPKPIKVTVERLDDVLSNSKITENIMIKIDVQGYELEAIAGAVKTIEKASVMILEMSFANLYEGQPLFHEVYTKVHSLGYSFHGSMAQMAHPITGEIVQIDAIFVNDKRPTNR